MKKSCRGLFRVAEGTRVGPAILPGDWIAVAPGTATLLPAVRVISEVVA